MEILVLIIWYSSILLDNCTCVLVELLKKLYEILMSSIKAMYTHITLACGQYHEYSLSSCALPPLNHAYAQYIKYKHPNCLYHGQHIYSIKSQQKVSGYGASAHY